MKRISGFLQTPLITPIDGVAADRRRPDGLGSESLLPDDVICVLCSAWGMIFRLSFGKVRMVAADLWGMRRCMGLWTARPWMVMPTS